MYMNPHGERRDQVGQNARDIQKVMQTEMEQGYWAACGWFSIQGLTVLYQNKFERSEGQVAICKPSQKHLILVLKKITGEKPPTFQMHMICKSLKRKKKKLRTIFYMYSFSFLQAFMIIELL